MAAAKKKNKRKHDAPKGTDVLAALGSKPVKKKPPCVGGPGLLLLLTKTPRRPQQDRPRREVDEYLLPAARRSRLLRLRPRPSASTGAGAIARATAAAAGYGGGREKERKKDDKERE